MELKWNFFPDPSIHPVNARGQKKAEKFVGRRTKMGVEQYQDYTLYLNVDRDELRGRDLNDEQLRADWQTEFPEAGPFTLNHVKGVRRDYLKGTIREATGTGSSHGVRGSSGEVIGPGSAKGPSEKTTTLSIRLNEKERALITEAASLREHSPTHLIKSAAISKAAHILNTSKETSFDFENIVLKVGSLLFNDFEFEYREILFGKEKRIMLGSDISDFTEWDGYTEEHPDADGKELSGVPEMWITCLDDDGNRREKAPVIRDNRSPLEREDFLTLRRAIRLGGSEFLELLLDNVGKRFFPDKSIDDPIDPRAIG